MQKCMHDISMDRGFGDESIDIKSAQLCSMNGRVYTPRRQRNIDFPVRGIILCFLGPRSRYVAQSRYSNPSNDILIVAKSRVC